MVARNYIYLFTIHLPFPFIMYKRKTILIYLLKVNELECKGDNNTMNIQYLSDHTYIGFKKRKPKQTPLLGIARLRRANIYFPAVIRFWDLSLQGVQPHSYRLSLLKHFIHFKSKFCSAYLSVFLWFIKPKPIVLISQLVIIKYIYV